MPKVIHYGGGVYEVPDSMSDQEAANAVLEASKIKPEAPKEEFPKVDAATQAERDVVAAQIRSKEVKHNPAEINAAIRDLEKAIRQRPINASVKQMLERELSYWQTAKEKLK